jgi:hypothetical protein
MSPAIVCPSVYQAPDLSKSRSLAEGRRRFNVIRANCGYAAINYHYISLSVIRAIQAKLDALALEAVGRPQRLARLGSL